MRLAIFVVGVVVIFILPYVFPPYISRGKPAVTTVSIPDLRPDIGPGFEIIWGEGLIWEIPFAQSLWSIHIIIMTLILVAMPSLSALLLFLLWKRKRERERKRWSVLIDGIKMISLPPPIITGITFILKPITIIPTDRAVLRMFFVLSVLNVFSIFAILYVSLGMVWIAPIEIYEFKEFVRLHYIGKLPSETLRENIIFTYEYENKEGWKYLKNFFELMGDIKWLVWLPLWILMFVFARRIFNAINTFLDGKYKEHSKPDLVDARPALIRFHNSVKTRHN